MNDIFRIETPGIDLGEVLSRVRDRLAGRSGEMVADDLADAGGDAVKINPPEKKEEILDFYLKSIVDSSRIDINDFEIPGEDTIFGRWEIRLKKLIWKLMKFYTFRLFSQQNDFNGRVALILQGINRKNSRRLEKLRQRVRALEERRAP